MFKLFALLVVAVAVQASGYGYEQQQHYPVAHGGYPVYPQPYGPKPRNLFLTFK